MAGHLNKSLTQNPTVLLAEVVVRDECLKNDEESNVEEKECSVKESVSNAKSSHHQRNRNYILFI